MGLLAVLAGAGVGAKHITGCKWIKSCSSRVLRNVFAFFMALLILHGLEAKERGEWAVWGSTVQQGPFWRGHQSASGQWWFTKKDPNKRM